MKTLAIAAVVCALTVPCYAQSNSSSEKKREVWVAPPTGSLIGRGAVDAGDSGQSQATAGRLTKEDAKLKRAIAELDAEGHTVVQGFALISNAVAHQTKVPVKTLKQQREQTDMSYGELLVANSLADGSGKSFNEIVTMRNKAGNWTQLAQSLKINPDSLVARAKAAKESIKFAESRRDLRRKENLRDHGMDTGQPNPQSRPGADG